MDKDKKEKILEATKKLIAKRGFKNISVKDITEKAGIAQGTLYIYFKNKEEIFFSLVDNFFSEVEKFIQDAKNFKGNCIDKLRVFVEEDMTFYEKNHNLFTTMGREMESIRNMCSMRYRQEIFERYLQLVDSIAEIIEEGIARKKIEKVTPREGSLVLVSIIHAYAGARLYNLINEPATQQSKKILDIFLKGVGT